MDISTESRQTAIQLKQTDQLFSALKYSAAGTLVVALTIVFIIGPRSDQQTAWNWFLVLLAISLYRWLVASLYARRNAQDRSRHHWRLQYNAGAYLAGLTWAAAMWLFYPVGHPEYQVLMVLALAGVASGAIAVLSYDKSIITIFLCVIMIGIESQLLWEGGQFSYQLAVLILLYFSFLVKGGRDIGQNFHELITLRQDTEEHNLTLLSTTERVARIGYWTWDMESTQIELSANMETMCGAESRYVTIQYCLDKVHVDDQARVEMAVDEAYKTGQESSVEYRMHVSDDDNWIIMNQVIKRITDSYGKHSLLGTVQDISVIKSAEQKIFDMAFNDELTGLANRGHFLQYLSEQIKHAARNHQKLAVLYFDLDGFKRINDTQGHDQGDLYLKSFAQRLKQKLRDSDFVARIGGDEFCVLIDALEKSMDAAHTAERCLSLSQQSIVINGQDITPRMSIGIAIYPQDGKEPDSLLRAADTAMYSAKRDGKHRFSFYDPEMTIEVETLLHLEEDLRKALDNDEFALWYQPKVTLENGQVTGVEALIRWLHPSRGWVPPDEFISTAERIGLIKEIGEWVLVTACRQQQLWKKQGMPLEMAVNISSSHFSSPTFVRTVEKIKHDFKLDDGELEIEITESMSRDPLKLTRVSQRLRNKGISVAIDDFGTGYSSLSVLKQLDTDTLKVDKSFIQQLPAEAPSALMVAAIVKMALGLGYKVVAEGVETLEQALFLKEIGCPLVQGYYFSRPLQADMVPAVVNTSFLLTADQASN